MEIEILVVGAGVAGLAAALSAIESGVKVAVFEKQPVIGGTSNFFEGVFAVESELQRKRYISLTKDEVFKAIMDYTHWRANARLVREIVNLSASTVAWLMEKGVVFSDVICNMPYGPQSYHVIKGGGSSVVKILADKIREMGGRIFTGRPIVEIYRDESSFVAVYHKEDEEGEIRSKALVLATGGYANNAEWIRRYCGFDLGKNLFPIGNVGKEGDGIRMAWSLGAAEEGMGTLELYRIGPIGPEFALKNPIEAVALQPFTLWIDPFGERFCDESIAFFDTSAGNANARYKEGYTFSIFDDSILSYVAEWGIERNIGMDMMPGTRLKDVRQLITEVIEKGTNEVFMAQDLKQLAKQIAVPEEVFEETVRTYTQACLDGYDPLFAKPRKYLLPLKGPTFFAVRVRTVFLGTLGGIKINHKAEVIDEKGRVIPGLYAAGLDAGGLYGDSYPINVATGLASAFAINSGRIAGKNAAEYVKRTH